MRREEEAVVLAVEARGESDRRAVLLAASGELIDTHAPAARRSQKRFGAALQPGTRIVARWDRRREAGVTVLEEAQVIAPPPPPDPLERYYTTAHLLETVRAFAREGTEEPKLYRLLVAALDQLALGAELAPLSRYVEGWTLRLCGLLPELTSCASCGRSLEGTTVRIAAERGAYCAEHAPPGARALSAEGARWLSRTRGVAPDAIPPLGETADRELAPLLTSLIESFTDRELLAWRGLQRLRRNPGGRGR